MFCGSPEIGPFQARLEFASDSAIWLKSVMQSLTGVSQTCLCLQFEDWNLRDALRLCELLRDDSSVNETVTKKIERPLQLRPKSLWQKTFMHLQNCSSSVSCFASI